MANDIYTKYAKTYTDKYTNKKTYEILPLPEISLEGASLYVVKPEDQYRPDLISYRLYGTIEFEDVITIANRFMDPIKDFYAGREIVLPSLTVCINVMET